MVAVPSRRRAATIGARRGEVSPPTAARDEGVDLRTYADAAEVRTAPAASWWRRTEVTGVIVLVAIGLALRLLALARQPVNADVAVVGLMAKDILAGHFSAFYWGQSYGGGEPYVVALVFRAAGASPFSLGLTPVLLDAGAALLVARIGRRLFSPRAGVVAATAFWIWPEVFLWQSTLEYGFRFAALDCGLGAMLVALRLLAGRASTDPDATTKQRIDLALLGLLLGLGWWCTPEIAYFAIPIALVGVVALARRRLELDRLGVLLGLAGVTLGALPWIWANVSSGGASLRSRPQPDPSLAGHLLALVNHALPMALGLQRQASGRWLFGPTAGVALEALAVLLVAWLLAWLVVERRGGLLVLGLVGFPLIYAYSPFTWFWRDGRYAIYLAPFLALVVGGGAERLALLLRPRAAWLGRLLAPGLLALGLASTLAIATTVAPFRPTYLAGTPRASWTSLTSNPNGFDVSLARALVARGVRDVVAGYWVAYPLTFASGGLVLASDVRYARSERLLAKVEAANPAWLFARRAGVGYVRLVNLTGASVLDPGCATLGDRCITPGLFERVLREEGIRFQAAALASFGVLLVRPERQPSLPPLLVAIHTMGRPSAR